MKNLFVVIMAVCRKNLHIDFSLKNAVNKSVLLCKLPTPSAFRLALQWLGMPQPRFRVRLQFLDKTTGLCKNLGFTLCKTLQIQCSLWHYNHLIRHIRCALERLSGLLREAFSFPLPVLIAAQHAQSWRRIPLSSSAWGLFSLSPTCSDILPHASSSIRCRPILPCHAISGHSVHSIVLRSYSSFFVLAAAKLSKNSE